MKNGKYPDEVQIFTFLLEYRFVWHQRFQKKFGRWISLGKSFLVVNNWRAPVQKPLKRSTLTFAHTFLTDCCTKPCPRFFNNKLFIFYCNNSTSFESVFWMKTVKSRLFKKYLKRRKSRARFCLSLGWLHLSEKELLKTAILLVQELRM